MSPSMPGEKIISLFVLIWIIIFHFPSYISASLVPRHQNDPSNAGISGDRSESDASPALPQLIRRDDDPYSCSEKKPCGNKACCGKVGVCGYGPAYCGTNGNSPNDKCWSHCDAVAECGQYAANPGQGCPLNVCCSHHCGSPSSGTKGPGDVQKRIIGYYESWVSSKKCMGMNMKQIPVESLTHLNYAFAYISPDSFQIGPMPDVDASTLSDFTALKSRNRGIVMGVSIGGWTFNDNDTTTQGVFADIASSKSKRAKFIGNLMSFMTHYGFDAVDIDWEYPGAPDRQPPRSDTKNDGANYVLLIQEMKDAFSKKHKKWEISFTAPTSYWYLRWFDIEGMAKAADYVNFMTYDLHGTWDGDNPIGRHALSHTNLTEIDLALQLLWRNKVDPRKVNLGLAFYSRTFTLEDPKCQKPGCAFKSGDGQGGGQKGACTQNSGTLSYREITDIIAQRPDMEVTYDREAGAKYFSWNRDQWASYDDKQTFQQKIDFANKQGLGGLLIWSVDQDDGNLDALRGVLYPKQLKVRETAANDVAYWNHKQPGDCEVTSCGGSCSPGTIYITDLKCPSGGSKNQRICCPIASAPDPKTCQWRGNPPLCNGQCHGGEVALASSKDGGNGHCRDGRQFYCCPVPAALDGGINCGWKGGKCSDDQTLMTFAGTFLEDLDPLISLAGLTGELLAGALDKLDIAKEQRYCCSKEEAKNWKDCYWAGTTGKGFDSCDDAHCNTGHEVMLTNSKYGEGETCAPQQRQRAFCCTPASGKSLFLPVPLEDLFPDLPKIDSEEPIFDLQIDDTFGSGSKPNGADDDPNDASFGFVVITSPKEVQVSFDKRDGAPWEVFDCPHENGHEGQQKVRVVCTDDSTDSRCNDIHLGHGVSGTIVEMPSGCGPGRYAVAKSLEESENQSLPGHIASRSSLAGLPRRRPRVLDLAFDYDFTRVPRAFGDSLMRIDFSNEEGYWNSVVDRSGGKSQHKTRRDVAEFPRDRKRWLEDEWRDAYHGGGLSREDLHRRWFGSDVLDWLAQLIKTGEAKGLHHTVDETLNVILIDQQFSCPVGAAHATASVKANLKAQVTADTSFGLTIITKLAVPLPDLSQSYLYFKNRGKITATFTLDAVASISYSTGDIKLIGLDDFPGATFRVPGIVTVGPNIAVYASADAAVTVAGHLQADVTIADWEIEQTYPQTKNHPADARKKPNSDGTQTIGKPRFEASVSASGEVALHLKPVVTFGINFDDRWKVPKCSVDLVLDGYIIFHAQLAASTGGDNSCPFSYGIDGGSNIFVQLNAPKLFSWGGQERVSIAEIPRKRLTPDTCEKHAGSVRRDPNLGSSGPYSWDVYPTHHEKLVAFADHYGYYVGQRNSSLVRSRSDSFSLGPLITIPTGFLSCASTAEDEENGCPLCQAIGTGTDALLTKRDDDGVQEQAMSCPWLPRPQDDSCSDSSIPKRATAFKEMTLSWAGIFLYSRYPSCSASDLGGISKVAKWFMPRKATANSCTPACEKYSKDSGKDTVQGVSIRKFATDHVFEVHLISDFLEWLCGTVSELSYLSGKIPFPEDWGRPDARWCQAVFGDNQGGFEFGVDSKDKHHANFVVNSAEILGGITNPSLLALYHEDNNGLKRTWTTAQNVDLSSFQTSTALVNVIKNSANVFQYQNQNIQDAWTKPSNSIEMLCHSFDESFWKDPNFATPAGSAALVRPTKPQGVTSWGLRTMWCYWIDRHATKIEERVAKWLPQAGQLLQGHTGGSSNVANNFLQKHMRGAAGLATVAQMHLPRDPNFQKIALPGDEGSATTTTSRFKMWGDNDLGMLGL